MRQRNVNLRYFSVKKQKQDHYQPMIFSQSTGGGVTKIRPSLGEAKCYLSAPIFLGLLTPGSPAHNFVGMN